MIQQYLQQQFYNLFLLHTRASFAISHTFNPVIMTEVCNPNATGFAHTCGQFAACLYSTKSSTHYACSHWSPFQVNAWVVLIYMIIPPLIGIGMLGGLGGGILKGPILEMMLNYSLTEATHISYCFMFGGTLLNTVFIFFESKPDELKRPIINFWIAVVFNLGIPWATNVGSSLAVFMPQLYIIILQELFLFLVIPIIWAKAAEQKARELKAKELEAQGKEAARVTQNLTKVTDSLDLDEKQQGDVIIPPLYQQFQKESENRFPVIPIFLILLSFGLNQTVIEMRSTEYYTSYVGIPDCTTGNNLILVLLVIVNVAYGAIVYYLGKRRELMMDSVNFKPEERYFTPISRFGLIYLGGCAAGFVSGFIGMGAGLTMVPVMLSYGLIARCASATSALNYFMISLNNLITLLLNHYLDWQTILLFSGLALIGGSVFTKIGYYWMNKNKTGYIVVYFVLALAIANVFSQIYYGVVSGERYGLTYLTEANKYC